MEGAPIYLNKTNETSPCLIDKDHIFILVTFTIIPESVGSIQ